MVHTIRRGSQMKRPSRRRARAKALPLGLRARPPFKKPVVKHYPCPGRELFLVTLFSYSPPLVLTAVPDERKLLDKMGYKIEVFDRLVSVHAHYPETMSMRIGFEKPNSSLFRLPEISGSRMKDGVQWDEWSNTYLCSRKPTPKRRPTMGSK